MNEEKIFKMKEFDEKQLSKLISDLRDINSYTSFKNGAYIYDLGKYQGNLLINYIEQLQNNWNELKNRTQKKIEQLEHFNEQLKTSPYTPQIETLKLTLKDMQELQGDDKN